ncbi:MAG: flotillin family protein [Lachnospiraceae bacterium]|nr:flotillin family protein [Lachnospiraceae bacterium]
MKDFFANNLGIIIPILVILLVVVILLLSGYVKASTDEAFIITGMRKRPKILIGRAGVKIPIFEKKDVLNLQLIPIDVKTSSAVPTADYINISVDAAVNVQIGNSSDMIEKASRNFLNKKTDYIAHVAREVLEGNMREIVGQMRLEDMVSDRQKFAQLVKDNAEPDLAGMGLQIISFNVQNFVDNDHVIENLGVDNVVKISKAAAISRAESERDIAIAKAQADKDANDAQVASETEIAIKQNELAIKQAELKREADIKRAEADAATSIEAENQRKTIEVNRTNADIARQEREIELKQKEVAVTEQALNAEIKKKAEAEKYRREQEAEAGLIERKKLAEAEKYEMERAAEARKAQADADMYAKQKEAEGIAAVGRAEAEAIAAKGKAEAEAMEKKAEAYAKYNSAAVTEMIINQLPAIAEAVAKPISSIDKVTVIDSGNGQSGVSSVGGYTPAVLAKVIESVKETTGFDLTEVMKAQTYDAKVTKNVNFSGIPSGAVDSEVMNTVKEKITEEATVPVVES